jgi:hypothetical protein
MSTAARAYAAQSPKKLLGLFGFVRRSPRAGYRFVIELASLKNEVAV